MSSVLARVFVAYPGLIYTMFAAIDVWAVFSGRDRLFALLMVIVHGAGAWGCVAGFVLLTMRSEVAIKTMTLGCGYVLATIVGSILLGSWPDIGERVVPLGMAGPLLLMTVLALVQVRRRTTRHWVAAGDTVG